MSSFRLIVVSRLIEQQLHSFLIGLFECFSVFSMRMMEDWSSGVNNPADSAIQCKKGHCTAQPILNCVGCTYITKNCISVLAMWCTTYCSMISSSNHASVKRYRWRHERCHHGQREWTKKETFYILYIYEYVNLQVVPGVLAATSGSFGVPPACSRPTNNSMRYPIPGGSGKMST